MFAVYIALAVLNVVITITVIALVIVQFTRPQSDCSQDPDSAESNTAAVGIFDPTAQTLSDAAHGATL